MTFVTDKKIILCSFIDDRKYTNGSVLRMHVDTANTHVVSAIINVDQELDKDVRLEMYYECDRHIKSIANANV